jgi:hypothetical protein
VRRGRLIGKRSIAESVEGVLSINRFSVLGANFVQGYDNQPSADPLDVEFSMVV